MKEMPSDTVNKKCMVNGMHTSVTYNHIISKRNWGN